EDSFEGSSHQPLSCPVNPATKIWAAPREDGEYFFATSPLPRTFGECYTCLKGDNQTADAVYGGYSPSTSCYTYNQPAKARR
ncbi:hypothetical protein ACH5RR_036779, partial [Cinchona calisaya]